MYVSSIRVQLLDSYSKVFYLDYGIADEDENLPLTNFQAQKFEIEGKISLKM